MAMLVPLQTEELPGLGGVSRFRESREIERIEDETSLDKHLGRVQVEVVDGVLAYYQNSSRVLI